MRDQPDRCRAVHGIRCAPKYITDPEGYAEGLAKLEAKRDREEAAHAGTSTRSLRTRGRG